MWAAVLLLAYMQSAVRVLQRLVVRSSNWESVDSIIATKSQCKVCFHLICEIWIKQPLCQPETVRVTDSECMLLQLKNFFSLWKLGRKHKREGKKKWFLISIRMTILIFSKTYWVANIHHNNYSMLTQCISLE